jgi:hypothetical protein
MINTLVQNKDSIYVICIIDSNFYEKCIQFYNNFINAKIYVLNYNSDSIKVSDKIIEPYNDRVILTHNSISDIKEEIDICYINEDYCDYIKYKISLKNIKLLINISGRLFDRSKNQIILVSVGVFQEYIIDNIEHLLKLNVDIHVITNSVFFPKLNKFKAVINIVDSDSLNIDIFNNKTKLNKTIRNGFWNNTSKRLFLLYEYIKLHDIKNVIHLENDVLLYKNMDYRMENKIYLTMDCNYRCIPGIIYIPNYKLMTNLICNYNFSSNDMINMGIFYNNNKDIVNTFPIIDNSIQKCIYNENFTEFNSIFDGAAIGQYLGGIDPRNRSGDTTGFVNETCVIKYNKYKFKWIKNGEYKLPYIQINKNLIPINNLHIHSKKLKKFSFNRYNTMIR